MDGFEFHRNSTDQDSAKRMALVRGGFLVWSLTWHDLEAALGRGDSAADILGEDDGQMARLQKTLDDRWDSALIRQRLSEPSLNLLIRYLQNPAPEQWKRAVFTELLRLFRPLEMQSAEMKRLFTEAALQLPEALREALSDLPSKTAFAGRGTWRHGPPDFAQLFLALPHTALPRTGNEAPKPDEMVVALHLDDAAQSEDQDYRRDWNGALRLFNLLQFLPNSWWTTALGVERHSYPEFPERKPVEAMPGQSDWEEAMSLAAAELHSVMKALASMVFPAPEVGFELTNATGLVVAEAELAWAAKLIAVLLPHQDQQAFLAAGWRTFPPGAADLATALAD